MKYTAAQNEQVPDRVHKTRSFRIVEYDSNRIEQTSNQQKNKAAKCDQVQQWFNGKNYRPSHQQVKG